MGRNIYIKIEIDFYNCVVVIFFIYPVVVFCHAFNYLNSLPKLYNVYMYVRVYINSNTVGIIGLWANDALWLYHFNISNLFDV